MHHPDSAELHRCEAGNFPWIVLDGFDGAEWEQPEYQDALTRLLETAQIIAVIPEDTSPPPHLLLSRGDAFVIDLDNPFGETGCVIMASGLGRRFGGNKLMADFHGEPMIARVLAATDFVPHRVVVTRHADVYDYCQCRNVPVVFHALPYRSDTVRLGLEALPGVERCIFCPGDQPLLTRETLMSLSLLAAACPGSIVRPIAAGQPGAPVVFPKWCFPTLLALPQGKGGGVVIANHPEKVVNLPIRDCHELMDVDTQEVYQELLSL